MTKIQDFLFNHQDIPYGDFTAKLIPTLPRESFIGVRSPEYKKILKELKDLDESEIKSFMNELPHKFHEENILQVVLINQIKDFSESIQELEKFLPYVDNWAVSDGISPKPAEKNKNQLISYVEKWVKSDLPYTKRVGMIFLKKYYLKESFNKQYLQWASEIRSEEYYVNMMTAWLFAEALIHQWDYTVEFLKNSALDSWTHNKAIQKARESFRITDEQKEYLKTLKRKK